MIVRTWEAAPAKVFVLGFSGLVRNVFAVLGPNFVYTLELFVRAVVQGTKFVWNFQFIV